MVSFVLLLEMVEAIGIKWQVTIKHVYLDANRCSDLLATMRANQQKIKGSVSR